METFTKLGTVEKDYTGFWGPVTATIDWCEANYEVNHFIAEFWNTLSNVTMIVPPMLGAMLSYKDNLPLHIVLSYASLLTVGIGSLLFHGTLLYENQLLDEIPMLWASAMLVFSKMHLGDSDVKVNKMLIFVLITYCVTTTLVYIIIKNPLFHELAYAAMALTIFATDVRICMYFSHSKFIFISGAVMYVTGFCIWNIDNIFCKHLQVARGSLGYPFKPLLQGHAWWHILAGMGTFFSILFTTDAQCRILKKTPRMKIHCGVPYIDCVDKIL